MKVCQVITSLWVPEAGASLGQDGMYVEVQAKLSACSLDTLSESAFAQATMLAPGMSDCPALPEGVGHVSLSV
jgi:hypothetical protein